MKFKYLAMVPLLLSGFSYAQEDHAKSLGLNLENESDLAVYMMLYQIGLKDRTNEILGDESCIDVSRDSLGNTNLSFGIKTDAFETGTVDFSSDNDKKFKLINGTLTDLFGFFKTAKYNPKISVRSYADPQYNIMRKYAEESTLRNKYASSLFDKNSDSDPRFDTDSKKRNYLLAYDRGESFINKYFPSDMKGKVKTTPYHSPNLEVGNNQNNSEAYACPNRRSIVVDMKFNPNLKIESKPGAFTPAFKVADGVSNHENILAAVFDAQDKDLNDLPLFCRNQSTKEFIELSKKRMSELTKLIQKPKSIQSIQASINDRLTEERIEIDCNRIKRAARGENENENFENCRKIKRSLITNFQAYSKDPSKQNFYNLMANLTVSSDRIRMLSIQNLCYSGSSYCDDYKDVIAKVNEISDPVVIQKAQRNSSHFMDCFSNELFYEKELKENAEEYITPVVDMRDPQTGEMTFSYTEDNVPKTENGKGFICQACGNGLRLDDGKFNYRHRASRNDHADYHLQDSIKTYSNLHASTDKKSIFLMGHQKGLSVYIIKDCKIDRPSLIAENSQMVNLEDLKSKKVKVGPNDCIFKPKVINSCVHMPKGAGGGDENNMSYVSQVPSMLTGKNLEVALEANASIVNSVFKGLKDDYIQTCQIGGENLKKVQEDPKSIIDGILCKNKGIHIPKASFDAKEDCPEVVKSISKN